MDYEAIIIDLEKRIDELREKLARADHEAELAYEAGFEDGFDSAMEEDAYV